MGLWDEVTNVFSGGGRNDLNDAYSRAAEYLEPYRAGGVEDYNTLRSDTRALGDRLTPYGNPAASRWSSIGKSPNAYYDEIMGGYSESPDAKYAREEAQRALDRSASASGMLGSGAYYKAAQENGVDIANRDRQRYFQNILGTDARQLQYLQDFRGEEEVKRQLLEFLTKLGYGASGGLAGNEINHGYANAQFDQQAFDDLMGIAMGAAGGGFGGGGGMAGMSLPSASSSRIPAYMM